VAWSTTNNSAADQIKLVKTWQGPGIADKVPSKITWGRKHDAPAYFILRMLPILLVVQDVTKLLRQLADLAHKESIDSPMAHIERLLQECDSWIVLHPGNHRRSQFGDSDSPVPVSNNISFKFDNLCFVINGLEILSNLDRHRHSPYHRHPHIQHAVSRGRITKRYGRVQMRTQLRPRHHRGSDAHALCICNSILFHCEDGDDPAEHHHQCCHNQCCHNQCCHNQCCHNQCCHNQCCHNQCCHNQSCGM
jgi:hypothetical protein